MILKRRKNWKAVRLKKFSSGYKIILDGTILRSPSEKECIIENQSIAREVHREWSNIDSEIDYNHMPYTKAWFISVDRSKNEALSLKHDIVSYGMSDLLCYRAEISSDLAKLQSKVWDPLLNWMHMQFHLRFSITHGVMPVEQSNDLEKELLSLVLPLRPLALTAINDLVTLSGSLVVGLAILNNRLSSEEAWKIIRIEENWQRDKWGTLDEHRAEDRLKKSLFMRSCKILQMVYKA